MGNVRAKEPWIGVLLNVIFPGFGELYAGRKVRAILIMAITILIAILLVVVSLNAISIVTDPNVKITGTLVAAGIIFSLFCSILYIFVLFDGYLCVRQYNISNGVKATNTIIRLLSIIAIISVYFVNLSTTGIYKIYFKDFFKAYKMSSNSMNPTLQKNDLFLMDRKAYVKNNPQRKDVVVFIYPKDRNKNIIMRIMGLPGETLEIKDGKIIINEKELGSKIHYYNKGEFGKENQKIKIPEGSYYVLGDNSMSSNDSRFWGFIPLEDIKGKAIKIYWPLSRSGKIE